MPELPEVETIRRELERVLVGQIVKSVEIKWIGTIKPLSAKKFSQQIVGQKIKKVERRAKVLLIELKDNHLAIHLKMTGQLIYTPKRGLIISGGHPNPPAGGNAFNYTRVVFNFASGDKLFFNDLRKFGWVRIFSDEVKEGWLARLGREPLAREFTFKKFSELIKRYPNRRLKQTLLDQTLIAGLGNIYVDESCFLAGIRPMRRVKTLTPSELEKLYSAIKRILKLSISKGGTSSKDYLRSDGSRGGFVAYLKVYGRGGKTCRRCGGVIKKIKLAGRGTHFCPQCQR